MPKLIMTKGLPASGKSTWAKEYVLGSGGRCKRINKDDLREMVDAGKWSREREKEILNIRDTLIIFWLNSGYDVICDDTNLAEKHLINLRQIVNNLNKDIIHLKGTANIEAKNLIEFEVNDSFLNVPLTECIERDVERGKKSVGRKVITKMYFDYIFNKFNWTDESVYNTIKDSPSTAIIVDLDGTLAIHDKRDPFDPKLIHTDLFNYNLWFILKNFKERIIFLSGREGNEFGRSETTKWIKKYTNMEEINLFMRKEGDNRKDSIVKEELYKIHIEPYYNIIAVFDDRDQVVDMWRNLGLFTCQVNYGGF